MGHIGLTPQTATMLGGFKAQGRTAAKAVRLYEDALALQEAGCFAIVLEAVPAPVAAAITRALEIPTIGIGAGAGCDGQVLVWHDLLGLYEGHAPRFVKQYAELAPVMQTAVAEYAGEVRGGSFPEEQHTYSIPEEELALFEEALAEVRARLVQELVVERPTDNIGTRVCRQLAHRVRAMHLRGPDGDVEPVRNRRVRVPVRKERRDLPLAGRERRRCRHRAYPALTGRSSASAASTFRSRRYYGLRRNPRRVS